MKNFNVQEFWNSKKYIFGDIFQGIVIVSIFAYLFYDSWIAALVLSPFVYVWHRENAAKRQKKSEELFLKMFREWILLLAAAMSAGYSLENAFGQSFRELSLMFPKGGVMLEELKQMLAKAENNQSPELLLEEFAKKYPFDEVKSFVEVFRTARGSGGSLNQIIRNTASQMAEVMDTKREIETLLAAKVYEQKIMTCMPIAVIFYIRLGSQEFLAGLYHNLVGIIIVSICLAVYLFAYLLGKRMVQFEI